MRALIAALGALVLLAGCGDEPPDQATSRGMVETTILDWHRAQAAGDGKAGCRLLTEKGQAALLKGDRKIAAIVGTSAPGSCAQAVAKYGSFSDTFRQAMLNTRVDAVRLDGERATATVHTSAVANGVLRQIPPADIALRRDDGRWLIG
jgi:hypothetical protein